MSNPWDVPELSDPDADEEKLYSSVGRALSAWEGFEHHLATLFGFFVSGSSDTNTPARRAYGSVVSFQGRKQMLEAAAEAYFASRPNHQMSHRVTDLLKKAENFSARRNEIAHGRVQSTYSTSDLTQVLKDPSLRRWAWAPSAYAAEKVQRALDLAGLYPKYIYSSKEIDGLAAHFRSLESEVFNLMMDWMKLYPDEAPSPRI